MNAFDFSPSFNYTPRRRVFSSIQKEKEENKTIIGYAIVDWNGLIGKRKSIGTVTCWMIA
jgi:hypothetical protein